MLFNNKNQNFFKKSPTFSYNAIKISAFKISNNTFIQIVYIGNVNSFRYSWGWDTAISSLITNVKSEIYITKDFIRDGQMLIDSV